MKSLTLPIQDLKPAFAAAPDDSALIEVQSLGKMYRIYDRPQDRLKLMLFARFGKNYGREFWALRNISFSMRRGERLGIIGRNGSGKSTLLQILAGTLAPSEGCAVVRGRVAALLELGSGFNPDFTGRENVFLNGVVLGLTRQEITGRFDDIAAFADIGEFIDQPVKTYSSGMFVRLAFAVATSVDAEILLIDEALAVGDVFFRQKCYQRLEALVEAGVSIILVSHALPEIEQFCTRALFLDAGQQIFMGDSSEAVKKYYLLDHEHRRVQVNAPAKPTHHIHPGKTRTPIFWASPEAGLDLSQATQVSAGWAHCTFVGLCDKTGRPRRFFHQGEAALFCYEFEIKKNVDVPIGGVVIKTEKGIIVHGKSTLEYGSEVPMQVKAGARLRFTQEIQLDLAIGDYTFLVGLSELSSADYFFRRDLPHHELTARTHRHCHLPTAGSFTVGFRLEAQPVQLLHHGLANLPGNCQAQLVNPE